MKTLKSLVCTLSLSALFLVSCGNENEPTNPGGGGTIPADRSQLVTSMIYYGDSFFDFTYDSNNRLIYVKGTDVGSDLYCEISYSPLSFIFGYENDIVGYDLKVNDDGYITYLKDNEGYVETFEYKDGYLVKSVFSNTDLLYTWENGNLMKIIIDFRDGKYIEYKYSYTEKSTDNTGVYFPHALEQNFMLLMGGLLGKTSVKVPVSVEITYSSRDETEKSNISVEYDSKGRIIKEFYNDKLENVYAYEGNKAVWPEN